MVNRLDKLTKSQKQAVLADSGNILLSAGAGSGKTTVLTERIIRKLMDGTRLEQLVVLTFTDLAAREMKQRLKDKLKDIKVLNSALKSIDSAVISTFDAFALKLVKDNHHRLGLPDSVAIADKVMMERLKTETLEKVVREHYLRNESWFEDLVRRLFNRGDEEIFKAVRLLEKSMETDPFAKKYLENIESTMNEEEQEKILDCFTGLILANVQEIIEDWEDFKAFLQPLDNEKIRRYKELMTDYYDNLALCKDVDLISDHLSGLRHPMKLRKSNDMDEDLLTDIGSKHEYLKDKVTNLAKAFKKIDYIDRETAIKDLTETKNTVIAIKRLTSEYLQELTSAKKHENMFEYTDIMNLAITLLEDNPDVLQRYRDYIDEIMVDEYQDTNDLQEYLLSLFAHDNLFMVGDIKQSIYGFRNANPDNFREKYFAYRDKLEGIAIDLAENFRSRREVLGGIDRFFRPMMSNDLGGIDYHDNQAMKFGFSEYEKHLDHNASYHPDLLFYDSKNLPEEYKQMPRPFLEAIIIKNDIARKLESGYSVYDHEHSCMRPVQLGDFAIIADRKSGFDRIRETLVNAGLPVVIYADQEFSATEEIQFIWHFVRLAAAMSNTYTIGDDLRHVFFGLARSFVYCIDDESIVTLLAGNEPSSIADLKRLKDREPFRKMITDLMQVVENQDRMDLPRLLENIYSTTGIINKLLSLEDPETRENKLDYLFERVLAMPGYLLSDLAEYLDFLFETKDIDIEYNRITNENKAAVKLMSMHKAKGLEFPVCYYYGLYKKFNYTENKNLFRYDREYGIITKSHNRSPHNTLLHHIVDNREYRRYVSERIRLLYVALTRAKEKQLIVVDIATLKAKKTPYDEKGYVRQSIRETYRSYMDLMSDLEFPVSWYREADLKERSYKQSAAISAETIPDRTYREFVFTTTDIVREHFSRGVRRLLDPEEHSKIATGTSLHRQMETIDFHDLERSLQHRRPEIREITKKLLRHDLFANLESAEIHQELPFVIASAEKETTGVIDLLLVWKDKAAIIDFKLSNLEKEAYILQLQGYRDYVMHVTGKSVETYLYSFSDDLLKKVGENDEDLS